MSFINFGNEENLLLGFRFNSNKQKGFFSECFIDFVSGVLTHKSLSKDKKLAQSTKVHCLEAAMLLRLLK